MSKYKLTGEGTVTLGDGVNFVNFGIFDDSQYARDYAAWIAEGNIPDPFQTRDELHAQRYAEVTNKTSALIDAPGYVYETVPFHTDITAQLNFTALFQVRSGLEYPYVVWDGDGSVVFDNEADLMDFCMGLLRHVETIRRTGKAIRDSLKDMTYQQLVDFTDPRS